MKILLRLLLYFTFIFFNCTSIFAQDSLHIKADSLSPILIDSLKSNNLNKQQKNENSASYILSNKNILKKKKINKTLTISYLIKISGIKSTSPGIEETYNVGSQTIFISNPKLRLRLVSLMRLHSIFFTFGADTGKHLITSVKESGKQKYKTKFTWYNWKELTHKYDNIQYQFTEDTLRIMDTICKKVFINLNDKTQIVAYYTEKLYNPYFGIALPEFDGIPGVVLKYEYKIKNKSITYTATDIKLNKISLDVFKIPTKGYAIRKYTTELITSIPAEEEKMDDEKDDDEDDSKKPATEPIKNSETKIPEATKSK